MSQDALQELMDGNRRFRDGQATAVNDAALRHELAGGQSPIAAVIRCADSRVAPEIVFDQSLGSLFVCGIAGNVPTPEIAQSLEYAVGPLGTNLIVIMGHTYCGAVAHAIAHQPTEGLFSMVDIPYDEEDAHAFNAEQGIPKLMALSPMIEAKVQSGELQIVAGVYDIESGEFELIAQTKLEQAIE